MTIDTDLATPDDEWQMTTETITREQIVKWLRQWGTYREMETELARLQQERQGYKRDFLAASERRETAERELARLQDGLRLTHEFARERLEDGHPGLLDMHLIEDKLRALLADTPEDGAK